MKLIHHGAHHGVTGSCHQLYLNDQESLLVDCGTFQGTDAHFHPNPEINFSLAGIQSLVLTHVHIDHVGRVPYLMGAGFNGPIYCSRPTAELLPLVIDDALRIGFTKNATLISRVIRRMQELLRPLTYGKWHGIHSGARIRLTPAGHVLGSAIIEIELPNETCVVFSGDLGPPGSPLLNPPQSPPRADLLVLESTYGDRLHPPSETRREELEKVLCRTFENGGVTIIPAFSLGRTQDILFELENILERYLCTGNCSLDHIEVIVDSPLASRYTEVYKRLSHHWGDEAKRILEVDDQPLVFKHLVTTRDHNEHRAVLNRLEKDNVSAIVIAGSGMCSGGRVVNYLKRFIGKPETDIVFVGYQAMGTPGHYIQHAGDWVRLDGRRFEIEAKIHTLTGYSAHADQADLIRFVEGFQTPPSKIRLVHGEYQPKKVLAAELVRRGYEVD